MATLADPAFYAKLRALNERFAASVPETLARLRAARSLIDPEAPDLRQVQDLHQLLHTVAGSAGTFGYAVFGQQSRRLEQALRELMRTETASSREWNDWLAGLDQLLHWASIDPKAAYYVSDSQQ